MTALASDTAPAPATTGGSPTAGTARFSMLAIDDNEADLDVVRRLVRRIPDWEVQLSTCADPIQGMALIESRPVDVVLVDYRLGAVNGVRLLEEMRNSGFQGAVIVLTGQGDERVAADALRAGAADYIPKQDLSGSSLRRSVSGALERSRLQIALTEHRRRLERANHDLQRRNAEIESFYHTLSHELKTPLTSAREFVSILREGMAGPLSPVQREYLEHVQDGCDRMAVYVNDMLDVTRIETGRLSIRPGQEDLGDLVRKAVASLSGRAATAGIGLELRVEPDLPAVQVDPHRIAQVLYNLIDNALKFTPSGGKVEIRAEADPTDADRLHVCVSDTGKGIPPEHLPNIFDRLYQVRDGTEQSRMGIGLGLFICREVVRLHGADITVRSEVGKGTAFTFGLPAVRDGQSSEPEGSLQHHAQDPRRR